MPNLAVGPHHRLEDRLGSECVFHETDDFLRAIDDEIGRDGVVSLGNRLYLGCHGCLFWFDESMQDDPAHVVCGIFDPVFE